MTGFVLLRLEAPLMAFGGPVVDHIGRTRAFPGQAQLTGLLANALGYAHGDAEALEALQRRLRFATAVVRRGELVRDYQTVDLGQAHLSGRGWTTRGCLEKRAGASSDTTHIRHRWYVADALVVVALTLVPVDEPPRLADVARALDRPARPIFIGRKSCLPVAPLRLAEIEAVDAVAALRQAPARLATVWPEKIEVEMDAAWPLPAEVMEVESARLVDRRDWRNQFHGGERAVHRFGLRIQVEASR